MTILVTGGAGFIGSHVAERLKQRGDDVVVIDNFNNYYNPAIKRANSERLHHLGVTIVEGDLRDADFVQQTMAEHAVKRIVHMAAMAGVRESTNQAPLYMAVNVTGTMNLYEAAKTLNADHIVLASTSSVYGKTEILPFVETDSADRPLAAYPASKRAAEMLAHTYFNLNGITTNALRFFNVYGPAGRPDMMPMKLMDATHNGELIKMFNGGDISRDWTYIDDIVTGVISALDRPMGYEVMNLGVGAPISLTEFIDIIEELSGKTINKTSVPTPPSDPPITYCDNSKARRLLDFNPQVSVFDGLQRTWDWYKRTNNV